MRVWDCTRFGTEALLPVLECRMATLDPYVHRFVIVEARTTFAGKSKPLWIREDWERFAPWHDRIVYLDIDLGGVQGWWAEHRMYEALWAGLAAAKPEDLVMAGDPDEIPPYPPPPNHVSRQRHLLHALDWQHPEPSRGTVAQQMMHIQSDMWDFVYHRADWPAEDGGWHLSWFGGRKAAQEKIEALPHANFPGWFVEAARLGTCQKQGLHLDRDNTVMQLQPTTEADWPPWAKDHAPPEWRKDGG